MARCVLRVLRCVCCGVVAFDFSDSQGLLMIHSTLAPHRLALRPVAGIFLECLEERLHWVGIWALWAKPRRAGVPGKGKGSGVLPGKADGAQQMTG